MAPLPATFGDYSNRPVCASADFQPWWSTFRPPPTAAQTAIRGLLLLRPLYRLDVGFEHGKTRHYLPEEIEQFRVAAGHALQAN